MVPLEPDAQDTLETAFNDRVFSKALPLLRNVLHVICCDLTRCV
jgi:hypothetical protein